MPQRLSASRIAEETRSASSARLIVGIFSLKSLPRVSASILKSHALQEGRRLRFLLYRVVRRGLISMRNSAVPTVAAPRGWHAACVARRNRGGDMRFLVR